MKIPKKFTLGAVEWSVEEQPLFENMGRCALTKATIFLDNSLATNVKKQTFCHELVHAFLFAMGIMEHDERLVDGMAVFLHQYLEQHGK